jgi:UDP-N-acetylmuramate--alanine ligase
VVFQPHTYTRTKALFDDFTDAFQSVDELILTDIYAAREKDIYNVSSEKLAQAITSKHPEQHVHYMKEFDEIADYLNQHIGPDDIVITMGAGDVYKVGNLLRA